MSHAVFHSMLIIAAALPLAACRTERLIAPNSPTPAGLPLGKAPRIQIDGVLVCAPESLTNRITASLRSRLTDATSVRQAIRILGPGYIPPDSGIGSIRWYFDDGVRLETFMWPESLDAPFRPRATTNLVLQSY